MLTFFAITGEANSFVRGRYPHRETMPRADLPVVVAEQGDEENRGPDRQGPPTPESAVRPARRGGFLLGPHVSPLHRVLDVVIVAYPDSQSREVLAALAAAGVAVNAGEYLVSDEYWATC
jgi:hypothetical protein